MINLLPPATKENFFYARRNVTMLQWLAGIAVGVAGIALVIGGGWLFLHQAVTDYSKGNDAAAAQLKSLNTAGVQKQVEDISNNLKLVVKVLSREVLFSKLLTQIGSVLPRGAVLTGLNIAQTSGGIDLEAAATDYQAAAQIQLNLQDPNSKIFSKADLVSIQCQATSGSGAAFSSTYPCKVQIRAQFATNNPYLFVNNTAGVKQ
ncbi:MAG TPA: PilN domain-containing protein [Patescibacteria group bacterium]|nr:PilN domain-containing protein [Patescibacteria group bacterium]